MNPREFCQSRGFARTLAGTFSFDPLFFERIVLRDLWSGGTSDITVIGDRSELQKSISRYAGQLIYLGKKYLLTPAETRGSFHPKFILRVGDKGAALLLGSGNLTYGGWGANRELMTVLELPAEKKESASIVNYILDAMSQYISGDITQAAITRIRDYEWLVESRSNDGHNVIITSEERSLSQELENRWKGRRFTRLLVYTGSTDDKGAFIEWCHKKFGIEECKITCTRENCSLDGNLTKKLSVKLVFAPYHNPHMLHAKFYWFDGPDGPAAIMGSANCSAAAWLSTPVNAGNVEALQIFDKADPTDFKNILDFFPAETLEIPLSSAEVKKEPGELPLYFASSITLRRNEGLIEVGLNRQPSKASSVTLFIDDRLSIPLRLNSTGKWFSRIDDVPAWPEMTSLAYLTIVDNNETIQTPPHWVNDADAIINAAQTVRITSVFDGLQKSRSSSEYDRVLNDLASVEAAIFSEKANIAEVRTIVKKMDDVHDSEKTAAPVTPEDILKSLSEIEIKASRSTGVGSGPIHVSLQGVMKVLFGSEERIQHVDIVEVEGSKTQEEEPPKDTPPRQQQREPQKEQPPDKYRQRLRKQLYAFVEKIHSDEFVATCGPTALVQATAYPLAVSLMGQKGSWLSHDDARAVVSRVADELLNVLWEKYNCRGILNAVRCRFEEPDRKEVFLSTVGDGTLWVALLAALAHCKWTESPDRFRRALHIATLTRCEMLRSQASLGKLGALLSRVQVDRAKEIIMAEAPLLICALDKMETLLRANYTTYLNVQSQIEHQVGEILWQPTAGWGVVSSLRSESRMEAYLHFRGKRTMIAAHGYYINVSQLAQINKDIKGALSTIVAS